MISSQRLRVKMLCQPHQIKINHVSNSNPAYGAFLPPESRHLPTSANITLCRISPLFKNNIQMFPSANTNKVRIYIHQLRSSALCMVGVR